MSSLSLEENERGYLPAGRIARVICVLKEGTKKVIARIDGHTVHGQTLRVRRLMEILPADGDVKVSSFVWLNLCETFASECHRIFINPYEVKQIVTFV